MDKQTKKEVAVAAGLSLIPYVGGSMAAVYTSIKNDKEFQRIEEFYSDVAKAIEGFDEKLETALKNSQHDEEYLTMLIENLTRKVEREARDIKRNSMKAFFTNALLNGVNAVSYSHIEFYLETLDSLSEVDIQLLLMLHQENKLTQVSSINTTGFNDPYYILASVNKLRSRGLIESVTGDFHIGSRDNALGDRIKVSSLGKDFISFCLS